MKTTIALADDHELFRNRLRSFLNDHRCNVLYDSAQGKELVKLLRNGAQLPDICILDLDMTTRNGITTAAEIHKLWPQIKIILYSMAHIPMLEKELTEIGISRYLIKGQNPQNLLNAIAGLAKEINNDKKSLLNSDRHLFTNSP